MKFGQLLVVTLLIIFPIKEKMEVTGHITNLYLYIIFDLLIATMPVMLQYRCKGDVLPRFIMITASI
jgi:hypothetical protein